MVAKLAPQKAVRAVGKHGKGRKGSKPGAAGQGHGQYTESQHPRDEHGHWIQTAGGIHRIKEGTPERRAGLANQISKARSRVKDKDGHRKLARTVRKLRATRRSRLVRAPEHGTAASASVKPPKLPTSTQHSTTKQIKPKVAKGIPAGNAPVGSAKARRAYADAQEMAVRDATGGEWFKDYEPYDVIVTKRKGRGEHAVEVKSMIYGKKTAISVHPGALVRKIDDAAAHPGRVYHTVVMDKRHESEGGRHAARSSGHEIYYKRAVGPYSLASMHKVKDMAELDRLIHTPTSKLPAAARGEFPDGEELATLRVQAAADDEYNRVRSKERKQKLGKAAYGR